MLKARLMNFWTFEGILAELVEGRAALEATPPRGHHGNDFYDFIEFRISLHFSIFLFFRLSGLIIFWFVCFYVVSFLVRPHVRGTSEPANR